ncbi:transglutaminase-like domain-containing protein [Xanthobacter agilis]|uniref:Transglutaminase-like putative cysteine protease n=1 Tax=Xanthobacter agilis TaxID=47492 RepID=A0ABU0LA65_XANAG|nr:transglutaminase family protein [Xanthobacter agilis]MDQ0504035.1 transglutaminase-like putative cysteine protease [Xanthobacter agilis]
MRVRIRHEITQRFAPGSRNLSVTVRLTPRPHEGQFIQRWTLDLNSDGRLHPLEDAFGNLCHAFSVDGPTDHVTVVAEGEVETFDTTGIVRGTVEPFPPALYLRETSLAHPTEAVITFADSVKDASPDPLSRLHALMVHLHETVAEIEPTPTIMPMSAHDALVAKASCPGGLAHLFTAAARHLGSPARHISGYLAEDDEGTARHWAEAYVPEIGWVAFDPGRNLCTTENYVRLAVGLDAFGVAPMRSTGFECRESVCAQDGRVPTRAVQSQSQGQN